MRLANLVLLAMLASGSAGLGRSLWVEIDSADPSADRALLEAADYDVAGTSDRAVGLIVDEPELECLRIEGWTAEVRGIGAPYREHAAPTDRLSPDLGYRTWAEVQSDLAALELIRPDLAQVVDLMAALSIPATAEGRHLLALKISDHVEAEEDEPAIFVIALHHARELNTIEAAFDTAEELITLYDADPRIANWVDQYETWVVPVVNPDGLEYVWNVDSHWRKNRRNNGLGSYGVDLNRNYPFLWGACGNVSATPDSPVFRGPNPASEPEVQAMIALAEAEQPLVVISYHSYGREVLYPYVCATMAEPVKIGAGRNVYASAAGYRARYASASGEDFEWHYNSRNSMAYLIEIGYGFQPPFQETMDEIEQRVRPAWRAVFGRLARAPGILGHVRDQADGTPIAAEIEIAEIPFEEDEALGSETRHGRFHVVLPPGSYTLTFSAAGYQPETFPVIVGRGWSDLPVWLHELP